MCYIPFYLSA